MVYFYVTNSSGSFGVEEALNGVIVIGIALAAGSKGMANDIELSYLVVAGHTDTIAGVVLYDIAASHACFCGHIDCEAGVANIAILDCAIVGMWSDLNPTFEIDPSLHV